MYTEDQLLPVSGRQHLLFCERQCALIHVEQVWDENRFTVEGTILHERVHEQGAEARGDVRSARGGRRRSLRLGGTGVADVVEYIHAGDAFQVVPSQRFSAEARTGALSIYRGLRAINPSPYMYFLEFGDFQIAGASPEPLLKVNGDRVEIRPIAGTSPRR